MSWSSVFSAGSRAETDWKEGSKVLFLNAANDGMAGKIAASIPGMFLSIRHMAEVRNGVEVLDSPVTKEWAGAVENYTLNETNEQTELTVETDITEEYKDYFARTWPQALARIKMLAEK